MKYFAVHSSRCQLKMALQALLKAAIEHGVHNDEIPKCVQSALDYADAVDAKLAGYEANWRQEFMDYFNSDNFSEQVSVEESESIFLTTLKGGSDITYDLLSRLGAEYQVNIDEVLNQKKQH